MAAVNEIDANIKYLDLYLLERLGSPALIDKMHWNV